MELIEHEIDEETTEYCIWVRHVNQSQKYEHPTYNDARRAAERALMSPDVLHVTLCRITTVEECCLERVPTAEPASLAAAAPGGEEEGE